MKISLSWLKEYIKLNESPEELSRILTDIGLEVGGIEEVESVKGGMKGLVIGEVLTCEQHPNADKLKCTTVNVGAEAPLNIVCGASNVAAGQKVVVATIGTVMYAGDDSFTIKKSKLRGELSEGMICAEDEIGLGDGHDGIMVLEETAQVGMPAAEYFKIESNTIIEIDITPNRADALSHLGVARDLKAYFEYRDEVKDVAKPSPNIEFTSESPVKLSIQNTDACPYYSGVVLEDIVVAPSPEWLQKKLISIGLNPINNVVDATNFVMHEIGQPLHAFDLDVVAGEVLVRKGLNQKFVTLDGNEIELHEDDLMICNGKEPMCIAGVFGGEKSGVKESTTKVFLESAYFNPVDVRKSSKRHALKTDSSYRFERGTDIRAVDYALDRCVEILEEIAGAKVVSKRITAGEKPQDFFDVIFRPAQVKQKLGLEIANEQIAKLLKALEMDVDTLDSETWNLKVPSYRVDVTREIDVLEDILRIHGYNDVPNQEQFKFALPNISGVQKESVQTKVSDFMVGKGFNELLNNSLTNLKYGEDLDVVRSDWNVELLNPLSNELAIMRQTLVFGVLESLVRNQNKKQPNNRFFEFGNTYMKVAEQKYIQKSRLAMAISGNLHEEHWSEKVVPVQFYHLMGYVQALMDKLGLPKLKAKSLENNQYDYHVDLKVGKKLIGTIGKISNKLAKKFGMKSDVFYAEFDWDVIVEFASNQSAKFKPLRKFHPVLRDFSLLIDEAIEYQAIENSVYQTERNLLSDVQLFDVYQGDKLPEGKKSYAMRFELYSDEETLKDKQINAIMSKIQSTLEKEFGAELR